MESLKLLSLNIQGKEHVLLGEISKVSEVYFPCFLGYINDIILFDNECLPIYIKNINTYLSFDSAEFLHHINLLICVNI